MGLSSWPSDSRANACAPRRKTEGRLAKSALEVVFVSLTGSGRAEIGAALRARVAGKAVRVHSAGRTPLARPTRTSRPHRGRSGSIFRKRSPSRLRTRCWRARTSSSPWVVASVYASAGGCATPRLARRRPRRRGPRRGSPRARRYRTTRARPRRGDRAGTVDSRSGRARIPALTAIRTSPSRGRQPRIS
jgi:hypothetical protein